MIVCATVGFVSGFLSNKSSSRLNSAFTISKGNAIASFQLYASFFKNNQSLHKFGKITESLSKLSWQFPQQILGVFIGQLTILTGVKSWQHHSSGVFLIRRKSFKKERKRYFFAGFTLGNIINYMGEASEEYGESEIKKLLFMHELGHYEQSKRWGWLYLPCIALPSILYAIIDKIVKKEGDLHSKMPWEIGADNRAKSFWANPKNLL